MPVNCFGTGIPLFEHSFRNSSICVESDVSVTDSADTVACPSVVRVPEESCCVAGCDPTEAEDGVDDVAFA